MNARPEITRRPEYDGYDCLKYPRHPGGDDFLTYVDGESAGGTYWATTYRSWASWGPAGPSFGHATRAGAEQVQVDAFLAKERAS